MKFLCNFWVGCCFIQFKTSCIASHLHYKNIFMHYRCVLYLLQCCVLVGLDWVEPMMYLCLHVTCSCIFMHTYLQFSIFVILYLVGAFLIISLSLSLPFSLFLMLVALWHLNVNRFHPGTLFIPGHLLFLLHLIPLHLTYGSMMKRSNRT